jgi:hypothetical protein
MHEPIGSVVTRITFKPDSAADFLFEDDVAAGRLVQERDDMTVEEATEFVGEFIDCLDEVQILIDGAKVVTMSDFIEPAEER